MPPKEFYLLQKVFQILNLEMGFVERIEDPINFDTVVNQYAINLSGWPACSASNEANY